MSKSYFIYLDVCCLNRPFDDWSYDRNRLEGEALIKIFKLVKSGKYKLVTSEAIQAELRKMTNIDKLKEIRELLKLVDYQIILNEEIDQRSQELEKLGFSLYDSFHVACAEYAKIDVLLTTDNRLLKKAIKYRNVLQVQLENPVTWLMNSFLLTGDDENDTD
ncbi:type II toxin-antitoxin system VapC family toxin [Aphanizomenon sp. PH219]|uniref:Type II toxin-antitoxin system VapC family toxin n=1 Tax=Dolichospermum heterosporum TAC447 TaxID=747523 RepID=A0ABY5LRV5_9CYAN|nr:MULTISPECIES: type II toxin-antitoxin system VapC family toxin [Aphanizomenonaceae]MDK2409914.1 type II toxin-antitoxin system VapC family toxin [Aphanizomenon sp. 202]MDK2458136.1 type II toxin-antitoxin system VapC family toxin [Aphanizomenon sp. PH219]UUO13554.1 type II toxin-antitoxin system VapC family toxin [Dolichospermum heterosporum TAC447]